MKRRFFFNGAAAPAWLAAGGTVLILAAVILLFAPPPSEEPADAPGEEAWNCYLLELRPGADDRFVTWLDEHDPALLVRADAARSPVRRLALRSRPEPPPPAWVRPEVMAFAPPPPEPSPLPLYAETLPPPEPAVRQPVQDRTPLPPLPRLRIGGHNEPLAMPETEFAGAASNLVVWFPETGEGMRYRIVRSSGDAALDLRVVRNLLRRPETPRGLVEVEWREER